jgi:hypothetical protein
VDGTSLALLLLYLAIFLGILIMLLIWFDRRNKKRINAEHISSN